MKIQQDMRFNQHFKVLMQQLWLMVKLVQEKHIQWKDLNIIV